MRFVKLNEETGGYEPIVLAPSLQGKIMSAIYAGPIAQEIFDQMQSDMDQIAQGDLFGKDDGDGFALVPSDVERCMEWRMNYYIDMQGHADEFERFEENFSFKKPYTSEDPVDSFKGNPSAQAFEAFMKF